MDISEIRDLLTQVQTGARVTTAVGDPVQVGDRVVIPVVEVAYAGGGGGGGGKMQEEQNGRGGGGGGGVRITPLGCWVIGPDYERWMPVINLNRLLPVTAGILLALFLTIRKLVRR